MKTAPKFHLPGFLALLCWFWQPQAHAEIDFDRDIAPVFRSYCAGCHNETDYEGDFSLETYASLREGGDEGDPIRPADAANSLLIKLIEHRSKPHMPPKDEPQVPAAELVTLKSWIEEGAPGPEKDRSLFSHLTVPAIAKSTKASPVTALAWSPDGSRRAVARYGRVDVLEGESNRMILAIDGLPGKVNAAHFSADNKRLLLATGITGLNGEGQLWDLVTGKRLYTLGGHKDVLFDAEISPDGRWLATAGYDGVIRIWNGSDGSFVREIAKHQGAIFDLAFHPDSRILASASADETVKLWRVSDGVRIDTLNQPQGEQVAVAFTNNGKHVISAGADKRLHFWKMVSVDQPALNPMVHSRFAHEGAITALLVMADGRHLISAAADRSLKVWSLPDLVEVHAYDPLPDVVSALTTLPGESSFAAARMDGSIQRYGLVANRLSQAMAPNRDGFLSADSIGDPGVFDEIEPNNSPADASVVKTPVEIKGAISHQGDSDLFRITARAGRPLFLAVDAARSGSKLDSMIEVLDMHGKPLEQVRLQATRDSWFTFRGKDSDTSDDFRLHNWDEMELNEYLYANGEVVQLWLYPRGPDSGYKVYPGTGKRHTSFFTTALSHPVGEPCYIVKPLPPGSEPPPNGLPIYSLFWENDDDPLRRWGADSQLLFDPPADGDYLVRVTDVRGFGESEGFRYNLLIRDRSPNFDIKIGGRNPKVSPGSGREITFTIDRHEGFDGSVRIDIENLPKGFTSSAPIEMEAGQHSAVAVLRAAADVADPDDKADQAVRLWATALIEGREVVKELGSLDNIQLAAAAEVTVEILRGDTAGAKPADTEKLTPIEFEIRPGETIKALVRATRNGFDARIELGKEDAGRNLPHGLYVDNIGLNGLLIVEGRTDREFSITAAPWVKPGTTRLFHLRATADGGQASAPALVRVVE